MQYKKPEHNAGLRSIDLFAGAGGLSAGLRMAGFNCIWANEHDEHAAKTFRENFPSCLVDTADIRTIAAIDVKTRLGLALGELDLVAGGPPCQGFSTYGQRDTADPRSELYKNFFEFVAAFRPKCFVMENVVGLLSIDGGNLLRKIRNIATNLSYKVNLYNIRAEYYGVPQRRRRLFLVGSTIGEAPELIPPEFGDPSAVSRVPADLFGPGTQLEPFRTVRDAISDLLDAPALSPRETHHAMQYPTPPESAYQAFIRSSSSHLRNHAAKRMLGTRRLRLALLRPGDYGERLRARVSQGGLPHAVIDEILSGHSSARELDGCRSQDVENELRLREMLHEGNHAITEIIEFIDHGGFKNKYRRLEWDKPSHTLVAHMARDCSDFVHPELDRFVTVREAARLQSFPDDFKLVGSQFQQFRQLGNAVPPLLAHVVGRSIINSLSDSRRVISNDAVFSRSASL